jgi:hypothetical protein
MVFIDLLLLPILQSISSISLCCRHPSPPPLSSTSIFVVVNLPLLQPLSRSFYLVVIEPPALCFCSQLPSISSISFFVVAPFPPFFIIDFHLQRCQPPAPSLWWSLNLLVGCDLLAALRFCGQLPGRPSSLSPSSIFFIVNFFLFPNV